MTPGLIFLVSFLIFLLVAYRFLAPPVKESFKKRVQSVADQLELAEKAAAETLKLLALEHKNCAKISKEIQLVKLKTEEESRILKREMATALSHIKKEKKLHHDLYLKRLSADAQSSFLTQVAHMTLKSFSHLVIEKRGEINHDAFNDRALKNILNEIKTARQEGRF